MANKNLENDVKNTENTKDTVDKSSRKIYQRRYYLKNRDKFRAYVRRYNSKNRDKINAYQRNYVRQRRKRDPEYRAKLRELTRKRHLDYQYSEYHRKSKRINMDGFTLPKNPEITSRRQKATEKLESLPSNVVTVKDMIKYYIYGDKNEK